MALLLLYMEFRWFWSRGNLRAGVLEYLVTCWALFFFFFFFFVCVLFGIGIGICIAFGDCICWGLRFWRVRQEAASCRRRATKLVQAL